MLSNRSLQAPNPPGSLVLYTLVAHAEPPQTWSELPARQNPAISSALNTSADSKQQSETLIAPPSAPPAPHRCISRCTCRPSRNMTHHCHHSNLGS